MIINNKVAINATETVKDKITFDREDKSKVGVTKGYYTDNGFFNDSEFMEEMLNIRKR